MTHYYAVLTNDLLIYGCNGRTDRVAMVQRTLGHR